MGISGDTVVVSARGEASNARGVNGNQSNNSVSSAGAAYVFVRNGTNWTQQAYLKASNTGEFDEFGYALAVSGDTVVVSARGEASNATGVNGNQSNNSAVLAGAAYVFVRMETNWTQQAYLKASNTGLEDWFGASVAISGDTAVIGAPEEDSNAIGVNGNQGKNSATSSGAAYVFVRNGTNWNQQAYLKASNTDADDHFGTSARVSGDVLVVGAYGEDSNATGVNGNQADNSAANSGAAYVFVRSGTNWSQQAYLKASDTIANDVLGWFGGVGISGETVVVGASNEDSSATDVNGQQNSNGAPESGAVYVFTGLGSPALPQLAIERFADSLRVSWSLSAADYLLEQTSVLISHRAGPFGRRSRFFTTPTTPAFLSRYQNQTPMNSSVSANHEGTSKRHGSQDEQLRRRCQHGQRARRDKKMQDKNMKTSPLSICVDLRTLRSEPLLRPSASENLFNFP